MPGIRGALHAPPQPGQPKLLGPEGEGGHAPHAYPREGNATKASLCLPGSHSLRNGTSALACLDWLPAHQLARKMFDPKTAPAEAPVPAQRAVLALLLCPLGHSPRGAIPHCQRMLLPLSRASGWRSVVRVNHSSCPQAGISVPCVGRGLGQGSSNTHGGPLGRGDDTDAAAKGFCGGAAAGW